MSELIDRTGDFSGCVAMPYDIFGVKLWSVESAGGYIHKYCDTKEDAERHTYGCIVKKLNSTIKGE